MSEQGQTVPAAKELRGYLTVTVPVSVLQRLQPFASRRAKSQFVSQAIAAALDQADQDRAPEPAGAGP
jgi:hypothetical protein